MSDKESKFVDTNPENQKPHNISGKNPRSIQTLHKSQVKPRSQEKDVEIEVTENVNTTYKTKTTYLVQKAKMQLKRRVAPGVSEIIIRKNEEKRKLAEEQAQKEAEEEQVKEAEVEAAAQDEIETEDETIVQEDVEIETEVEEPAETVEEKVETSEETTTTGKSFTQTLREQGAIYGQKIVDAVEKAKPEIEATLQDAKKIVDNEAEKAKSEPSTAGKSFTQVLREQGFIEGQKIIKAVEKAKPEIEATIQEAKTTVEKVVEEATTPAETKETPKEETATDGKSFTQTLREQGFIQTGTETTETPKEESVEKVVEEKTAPAETPKEETATDGKSFTQTLREQGFIQTGTETTETPKEETVEKVVEETKENISEDKKEDDDSNGEVKTFIDLIRSEGLL